MLELVEEAILAVEEERKSAGPKVSVKVVPNAAAQHEPDDEEADDESLADGIDNGMIDGEESPPFEPDDPDGAQETARERVPADPF